MPDGDLPKALERASPDRRTPALRRVQADPLAVRSAFLVALFCFYLRLSVGRTFHALRLARPGSPTLPAGTPVVVYSNHPSWWDPAVFFVLQQVCFPGRAGFGPMDTGALEQYGLFKRLGVFGIERGARGAARFLSVATRILAHPVSVLWVTAEGTFTDARTRPVRLRPGIGHLARRIPGVVLVPLALEYTFWNESKPEALMQFGRPLTGDPSLSVAEWTTRLETALAESMDALAAAALARDPARFETLTQGAVGIGGPYDWWRRVKAAVSGRRFDPTHEGREA